MVGFDRCSGARPPRLAAVEATRLIGTELEDLFERLTRLAASTLQVPWAVVTLVDDHRSFWKSWFGVGELEVSDRENLVEESGMGSKLRQPWRSFEVR